MKCPHCNEEMPAKICANCGTQVPLQSRYCMECGSPLEQREHVHADPEEGFDPNERILCPDGTCTGIIEDGKCTECGRPYSGESSQGSQS